MRKLSIFILFTILISSTAWAGFLPENKLKIPVDKNSPTGISQIDFEQTQNELKNIYTPIAKSLGGNLVFVSNWQSSTVNAYASRHGQEDEDGEETEPRNEWRLTFLGGLARHKFMTRDGFSLVICHEIGHQMGGAPRLDGDTYWASIEGQSDYFATAKCLRRLWMKKNNSKALQGKIIPEILMQKCSEQWKAIQDRELCLRSGLAAESVAQVFASLKTFSKPPKFETPDSKVVKKTDNSHPAPQCRLDTYLAGALCEISYLDDLGDDEFKGACHMRSGQQIGLRPACWFKSN